jgi:hypothetical protein
MPYLLVSSLDTIVPLYADQNIPSASHQNFHVLDVLACSIDSGHTRGHLSDYVERSETLLNAVTTPTAAEQKPQQNDPHQTNPRHYRPSQSHSQ